MLQTTANQDILPALMARYPRLDPKRVVRALEIVRKHNALPARYNKDGMPIQPGNKLYIVRSESNWGYYYVDTVERTCTCPDSQKGNVCKHRIAVFLITRFFREETRQYIQQTINH